MNLKHKAGISSIRDNRTSEFTRLANMLGKTPCFTLDTLMKMGRAQELLNHNQGRLISDDLFDALAKGQMEVMDARTEKEALESLADMLFAASTATRVINAMVTSTKAIARVRFDTLCVGSLSHEACRNKLGNMED